MNELAIMAWLVALLFGAIFWFHPFVLRYLATRMWARAHALETGRQAYQEMIARVEPKKEANG